MPGRSRISDRFEGLSIETSICMNCRLVGRNGHSCGGGKDSNRRREIIRMQLYVPYFQGFLMTAAWMRASSSHVVLLYLEGINPADLEF